LLQVVPPVVHLSAMQGKTTVDVSGSANLTLFPSALGDLSIYAGQNVQLQSHGNGGLVMADGDPLRWPSVTMPAKERDDDSTPRLAENIKLPELGLGDNTDVAQPWPRGCLRARTWLSLQEMPPTS